MDLHVEQLKVEALSPPYHQARKDITDIVKSGPPLQSVHLLISLLRSLLIRDGKLKPKTSFKKRQLLQ